MSKSAVLQIQESASPTQQIVASSKVTLLGHEGPVRAYIDFACSAEGGGMAFIGWVYDPENRVHGFALLHEGSGGLKHKETHWVTHIKDFLDGVRIVSVARPDVTTAMAVQGTAKQQDHGFAMALPEQAMGGKLALEMVDGTFALLECQVLENLAEIEQALQHYWVHSGDAFLNSLLYTFGEAHSLTEMAFRLEFGSNAVEQNKTFCACDQAIALNGRTLILNGWIAKASCDIKKVELISGDVTTNITSQLHRYVRPDLVGAFPWSDDHALGFLCVLPGMVTLSSGIKIKVIDRNGRSQVIKVEVQKADWSSLEAFIEHHSVLALSLLDLLMSAAERENKKNGFEKHITQLQRKLFLSRHPHLPTFVEQPSTLVAAIDRAYPLGQAGLLIFGWMFAPKIQPKSIAVRHEGSKVDVTNQFSTTLRADVAQSYRQRYPEVNEWCGFICWAPMPTRAGDARSLCFDFGEMGDVWLKVPTEKHELEGLALMKEILGMVPSPERMRHKLYDTFDKGLGHALEAVNNSRPKFTGPVEVSQYGVPVTHAEISVIVPLYGRFDFLRYQLALFCDDTEFASADLIYVVDDPSILSQTLDLAARYHALFKVPFRVVWYGQNRGFAGANNIGASLARGDYLVLLNSDVMPQQPGWMGTLKQALDNLPDAGAVAPLLQFGDDSIQHAGMYPRHDAALPGFSLNTHKGMGMTWEGGEEPSEHPMLTAACQMLRARDYQALGGFDEGYVIGDFEDSDLCMALRKQGKRLWLVPQARLWHLERQSQNLSNALGHRQMITLFNGWRYSNKIRNGEIADPMSVEIN